MVINKEPYFMKKDEWWETNDEFGISVLTDKAPTKAKLSYQKFMKDLYLGNPEQYEEFLENLKTINRQKEADKALKELQSKKL